MSRSSTLLALPPLLLLFFTGCGRTTYEQEPYTLQNVCRRLPSDLCAVRESGCKTSGIGFDRDVCETRELVSCEDNVEEVRQGEVTFHAEEVSACLASLEPASERGETDLHATLVAEGPCARIFRGKLGPFDHCDRDSQCAQPEARDGVARCNRDERCEVVRVLQEGERCEVSDEETHHCDAGLVCQLPASDGSPDVGICTPQLELGASCTPFADTESCGREGHCDLSSLTCEPRRTLGARCFFGRDCLSGRCDDERCGPDTTLFTGLECGQPCIGSLCD